MTETPTPTWEEAISEILIKYGRWVDSGENTPTTLSFSQANAAINKAVLGLVIGEDTPYSMNNHATINAKNNLRAAQRRVVRGE